MKDFILVLCGALIGMFLGVLVAELKINAYTGYTTFGYTDLLVECQKNLPRNKECKFEIKATEEN